jgi:hypothetical protein
MFRAICRRAGRNEHPLEVLRYEQKRNAAAFARQRPRRRRYIRPRLPKTKLTTARISPTTNKIHAICEDRPAIPVSPNTPAINATTKNINAMYSM